jgi:hypothetical protein
MLVVLPTLNLNIMTLTAKLPAALEQGLRQRSAALGRPASELVRDEWRAYLAETKAPTSSAYELGQDIFGQKHGPVDLAEKLKKCWWKFGLRK